MKDFKKMPKMADGGSVKKMSWDDVQKYVDEIPKRKAEAEQRMKDYKEGNAKSMAQFRENMSNISKDYDNKIAEAKLKYPPTKGGSGGSMGGGDMSGMKGLDKPYKRGGKVKK
jgi:hypothetical protein